MIESIKEIIQILIGEWGWGIIVAMIAVAFKDTIVQTWSGFMFLIGHDFNIDDVVWIRGKKKAIIVRQNLYKTTFYLPDHQRKFVVPNSMIWELEIEKDVPTSRYYKKTDHIEVSHEIKKL